MGGVPILLRQLHVPYGPLPEPITLISREEFDRFCASLPRPDSRVVLLTVNDINCPGLQHATQQWTFDDRFVLAVIPASDEATEPQP